MAEVSDFVVKHTFLELASDHDGDCQNCPLRPRRRTFSDSCIEYETPLKKDDASECGSTTAESGLEVEEETEASSAIAEEIPSEEEVSQPKNNWAPFQQVGSAMVSPVGAPVMFMLSVAPDGSQVLVPVSAASMPVWDQNGVPMMPVGVPQSPTMGMMPVEGEDAATLEAKAAALTAYAAKVKAEARRAKAAASAVSRRCLTSKRTEQRRTSSSEEQTIAAADVSCSDQSFNDAEIENDDRTTLMFRNLPNNYTRAALLDMLDSEGFNLDYSFVYLPTDFKNFAGFGYAFVNFATHDGALKAKRHFQNYARWKVPSRKVCDVVWSGPVQGLSAHTERYRNSPVMHESVPDEYKPVIYVNGVRAAFPAPSKRIRPPRIRHGIATEAVAAEGAMSHKRR